MYSIHTYVMVVVSLCMRNPALPPPPLQPKVIARKSPTAKAALKRTDSQCTNEEEDLHQGREVGIDVGPSSQSTTSFAPSQDSFSSNTTPSTHRREVKLSQDSLRSDQELHLSDPLSEHHRHPVAEGHRRGDTPAVRSGLSQKQAVILENGAYAHPEEPLSPSSSSLSQSSDRGGKPLSSVMSPPHVDSSRSGVMSPLAVDMGVPVSPAQATNRRMCKRLLLCWLCCHVCNIQYVTT